MIVSILACRQVIRVAVVMGATCVPFLLPGALSSQQGKAERSWPMFGGSPGRNMVNTVERNIAADWHVADGKPKNVKWVADLGDSSFGQPVVAGGKVFVATNNAKPRDPNVKARKAVLMAFRETDGRFLWQIANDLPDDGRFYGNAHGVPSTPAVIDGKVYFTVAGCQIACADAENGKIEWRYDMKKELQADPGDPFCIVPPLSSPLVIGNLVFANTGNGRDPLDGNLPSPKAPSFIALDKRTGKLAWQSNLPGENIIDGQWSSPTFALLDGVPQVIFAGGDCVIYSFAPETGKLLWKCDCLPTRRKGVHEFDNYIVSTPVVVGDKLYVGLGHAERPPNTKWSYFLCLDISKKGDVSLKSYDAKSELNKDSALVWSFGGPVTPPTKKGRQDHFGSTNSTAAVQDGLVYITEQNGYLHCLDAATGKLVWTHDFRTATGGAYWVDGRVFVGTEDGDIVIFAHGRAKKVLATIDMEETIRTTPVAVNGVLYVATRLKLFAIGAR